MFVEDVYRSSLSKSLPLQFLRDESGIKFFFFFPSPFQPWIGYSLLKDIDYDLGWRIEQKGGGELPSQGTRLTGQWGWGLSALIFQKER